MGYGYGSHWISDDTEVVIKVCKSCGKKYKSVIEEQMAGFRQSSEDECPYCGHVHMKSMSFEYTNSKIEERTEDAGM